MSRDWWGSDPAHPLTDWQYEVANGDTRLGYWAWVDARVVNDNGGVDGSAQPTPNVELLVVRDPDGGTHSTLFIDGVRTPFTEEVVDAGYGHQAEEWFGRIDALDAQVELGHASPAFAAAATSALSDPPGAGHFIDGWDEWVLHRHTFQGQSLVHRHAGGDQSHGYYGHDEDAGNADGCEGHESLAGEHMGETVFCDGSCRRRSGDVEYERID